MERSLRTAYLYPNGLSIEVWEKRDKDGLFQEYIDIHERYCQADFEKGRLIYSDPKWYPYYDLSKGSRITIGDSGSQRTKELGVSVLYVCITLKNGKSLYVQHFPGVLQGVVYHQEDIFGREIEIPEFAQLQEAREWSGFQIRKYFPEIKK